MSSGSREIKVKCVRCPKGCDITVKVSEGKVLEISGNGCPLGVEYAKQEAIDPRRVVCTTIKILGARYPRLPVRTKDPVPKDKIFEVISALRGIVVEAPIKGGQVILEDVAGTGVPIIAERSMERVSKNGRSDERKNEKV